MGKRQIDPFSYMVWAKSSAARGQLHLGMSGLPPAPEMTEATVTIDLRQGGPDMPPEAAERLSRRFGAAPDELLLTAGTSQAVYLACASQLSPGDVCLVESPAYELLPKLPLLFGARVERFTRAMADGFRLPADLPAQIRHLRPRLTVLTNPHNPSGALLSLAELATAASAAAEVGGLLLVDEVYMEFLPDAPERCARKLDGVSSEEREAVVVASSFTKAYGLGAARFGWLLGARAVVRRAIRYNDYVTVYYPSPSAAVGLAALDRLDRLQQRAAEVSARGRQVLAEWVEARDDVRWHRPDAGVMALLELCRVRDARAFCQQLRDEHGVVVVPGDFFDAPGCIRVGYGLDESDLREGLRKLGECLDGVENRRLTGDDRR